MLEYDARIDRRIMKKRAIGNDGTPLGTHNSNVLVDTSIYKVEFENGDIEVMAVNTITENLLAQVDEQDHQHLMLDEIVDHRVMGDAIPKSKGTYVASQGTNLKSRPLGGGKCM